MRRIRSLSWPRRPSMRVCLDTQEEIMLSVLSHRSGAERGAILRHALRFAWRIWRKHGVMVFRPSRVRRIPSLIP